MKTEVVYYSVKGDFCKYPPFAYLEECVSVINGNACKSCRLERIEDKDAQRIEDDAIVILFANGEETYRAQTALAARCTGARVYLYSADGADKTAMPGITVFSGEEPEIAIAALTDLTAASGAVLTVKNGRLNLYGKNIESVGLKGLPRTLRQLAEKDFKKFGLLYARACADAFVMLNANGGIEDAEAYLEKSVNAYERTLSEGEDADVATEYARLCTEAARAYSRYDECDDAATYAAKAAETLEKNGNGYAEACFLCADACRHAGRRRQAVEYALKAADGAVKERRADVLVQACLLAHDSLTDETDKGAIMRKSLLEKALVFEREIDGCEDAGVVKSAAMLCLRAGEHSFFYDKDYKKAMSRYRKVIDKLKNTKSKDVACYSDFAAARAGIAGFACGEYEDAEKYLEQGLKGFESADDAVRTLYADLIAETYFTLAKLYGTDGGKTKDREDLKRAAEFCLSAVERYGILCGTYPEEYGGKLREALKEADALCKELDGKGDGGSESAECAARLASLKNKYRDQC